MKVHWTERSIKDYFFRIAFDLIVQFEKKMESENISKAELAKRLKITKGRVSQVLNNPGNISIRNIVKYARMLDMKVSILAYEDDDPQNKKGPINPEIFKICWENSGKPRDFWAFQETLGSSKVVDNVEEGIQWNATYGGIPCFSSAIVDLPYGERSASQNIDLKQNLDAVGTGQPAHA